jgi:hypothetical protein
MIGNSGGKPGRSGRKSRFDEVELGRVLGSCWKLKDRRQAIRKLATMANDGDIAAITLLMNYTYGKPQARVEHSGCLELAVGRVSDWADVKQLCIDEGIDLELVKHETRRLLSQAEDDADDEGWKS